MSSQHTATLDLLLWTLLLVAVVGSVSAFPTGSGDSRLLDRQPRFVHYEPNPDSEPNPYRPCERRGFRRDLQLTARTIQQTNNTLTIMKQDLFRGVFPTFADIEEDGGQLVPLFRNLTSYELTIPTVILEAQELNDYSDTLRQAMHDTGEYLNKLLFKLGFTLRAAGELEDQSWTADSMSLPDPEGSQYWHYVRDVTFFQHLSGALERLKAQLEARLAEC